MQSDAMQLAESLAMVQKTKKQSITNCTSLKCRLVQSASWQGRDANGQQERMWHTARLM